jgi:alpha-2-macroglobulin
MSANLRQRARPILHSLFGEVHWQSPPWLNWLAVHLCDRARATLVYVRQNPRRSGIAAALVLLLTCAAYAGWRWYESLPKPVETQFTVHAPEVTCYSCDPPGKPNPVLVRFSQSAAPLQLTGKDIDPASAAVHMAPAMKGVWRWDDDRTLRFQPAQDWPIGTTFHVTFERHGFVPSHVRLQGYGFEFQSPAFWARVSDTQFHQDPVVASDKKVVVTVTFSHPVDPEQLEKRINLTLFERATDTIEKDAGKTPFTVIYDKLRLTAYIHSALPAVQNKEGRVRIRIDSGVRAARGGNETETRMESSVVVPGLYSLQADSMQLAVAKNEHDEPSQVLIIRMNHSVIERDMSHAVHAWRLPATHPDKKVQEEFEKYQHGPYRWTEQTVTSSILAKAAPLTLTQIPGELEHYELHSFRHDAEPGEYLYVKLDKGLKSFGGYVLDHSIEAVFNVPPYPRELRIAQQGSLLALSGSKSLTVMTRDVATVCADIGRLLPQQIQHLVSQTEGTFSSPDFRNWSFDTANITEHFSKVYELPALKPGTAHYQTVPLDSYLANDAGDRRGIFFVTVRMCTPDAKGNPEPRTDDKWHGSSRQQLTDARLIVLTDLGLLAKQSLDGSQDVFIQSIHTGRPLADVRVEILGRNGQTVLAGTSDADGHVHFPDLRSFKHEQQPVVYLAHRGGDSSFLPIADRDRRLDLSRFDVGGVDNRVDQEALSAYLFSDRGLYRPGEDIHLAAIVRSQDWKRSMQGVPLRLEVIDPRGILVRDEPFAPGPAGFSEIRHTTRPSSPAGNYRVSISLETPRGGRDLLGSTVVQVREFLPDRLRMTTHFSTESAEGWVPPEDLNARINLQNLFGTPAAKRRVTAHMRLSPAFPSFKAYPDYQFYDPQSTRQSFEETLSPAVTSDEGAATFELNLRRFARATYQLHIATEGFEADGGRGVSSEAVQLVANMPYLVGWKADGDLGYISRNAQRTVQLIAIDPAAHRKDVANLRIARFEIRYVSTLIRQNNGTFQYESRRKEIPLEARDSDLPATGLNLQLETAAPGAFAYLLTDPAGLQLARIDYHVTGNANLTRTLEKDAQLQIALAHSDYAAGDEIEMQIQAPYVGSGLITIERDKVYAWRWFHTTTTSSTQSIKLPAGIEGNAYIHVAFVRDPASDEIYASPLSYGVQPFSISLDTRRNPIHLETPALIKPGSELELKYSTQKPARIAVFAVDEGVLQVARYHTPDPLGHFFQKRSLDVATTQILDLILPEFRRRGLDTAAGGDQDSGLGRHLNPFGRKADKPVAYWSGIVDADSATRTLKYLVPDYFNGTLRIFAVAVSDDAVGVQDTRSLVRADFVLSPNAPTTVTPGDEFEVSVGVANNLPESGDHAQVSVSLEPGKSLAAVGNASQTLTIAQNHEASARFRLKTSDKLGPVDLVFTAGVGAAKAHRRINLSVRPATPFMTSLEAGSLKQGSRDVPIERDLYVEHRKLQASFSLLPLSLAHGLVTYLGNYPYSCTEQLVSQAMPALLLAERPEFGYVRAQPGADIEGLINELRVRQNDEGAYRLWPGGNYVVEFVSLYAQHFLIEAGNRGERVPAGLVDSGNAYLRAIATRDGNNLAQERNSAYAIYLLTRQDQVMSAQAAALRKRLTEHYKREWQQDLAAAWLAASFKLMHQDRDAADAISSLRFTDIAASEPFGYSDELTRDGFLLYVLARHFPERLHELPPEVLDRIAALITTGQYHSLSAGTTLLGLEAFVHAAQADTAPRLAIHEVLEDKDTVRPLELPQTLMPTVPFTPDARALRFANGSGLNAFYLVDQSGFDRATPKRAISQGFEIIREYTDEAGHPLQKVELGAEINVHLKFRAIEDRGTQDVALVDLLPGGFDLVVPPQESNIQGGYFELRAGIRPGGGWGCQFCYGQSATTLTFADPREDRVVFYGTVTRELQEVQYRIKASNVGSYAVPPAYGEAMYDRNVIARSIAGRVEVVRP